MTRELPKVGYRLSILIPARWNQDVFTGVCLANGCPLVTASAVALDLDWNRERCVTVRPLADPEKFKAACETLGVHVEEIPPR